MTDGSAGQGARGPRVVVVGGSMGGLLAGSMLHRAGCDVTVHERIATELAERGVGIATHPELHAALESLGAFHRRGVWHAARGAHYPRHRRQHPRALSLSPDPGILGAPLRPAAQQLPRRALHRRRQLHRLRAPWRRRARALRGWHEHRGRSPDRRRRRALHRSPPALAGCGAQVRRLRGLARHCRRGPALGGVARHADGALHRLPAARRARGRLPGGGRGRRAQPRQAPLQHRLVHADPGREAAADADRRHRPLSRGGDRAAPHPPVVHR